MTLLASPLLVRSGIALLALTLSGCTLAPGMYTRDAMDAAFRPNAKLGGAAPSASAWPKWLRSPDQAAAEPDASAATPPPGVLLSITPELIRQQRAAQPSDLAQDIKSLFGKAKPYRIGPGDVISVVLWSHPEIVLPPSSALMANDITGQTALGNGFNVSPDGLIQFPYVGAIKVGGLTEYEARELLLRESARYLKDPQITVRIMAFRSERVYVDGEVRTPGLLAVNDVPLTLPDAISRAGGYTAVADRSAVALTRGQRTTVISLQQLTELGVNPSSILLAGGDLVRVLSREDSKVFVMGEVTRPAPLLMRNGRMTLNEALGETGGVNPVSGDPRQIYVVRNAAAGNAEVYHLDASSPVALALAEGFELKPRDVVFVDPAPLALWNRVISLLLPSAYLANTSLAIRNQNP